MLLNCSPKKLISPLIIRRFVTLRGNGHGRDPAKDSAYRGSKTLYDNKAGEERDEGNGKYAQ